MTEKIIPSSPKSIKICAIEDCGIANRITRGYCIKHYKRLMQYGDPLLKLRSTKDEVIICLVDTCESRSHCKGYCQKHYTRWRRHGDCQRARKNHGVGRTPIERFWSKVAITANPDKCWEWQGSVSKVTGYGSYQVDRKGWLTHRYAWFIAHGEVPSLVIRHTCDNRKCVNPSHLLQGTTQDNVNDKVSRNRQSKGSSHGMAKLNEAQVREIKQKLREGARVANIASAYLISNATVNYIRQNRLWRHVD